MRGRDVPPTPVAGNFQSTMGATMGSATIQDHLRGTGPHDWAEVAVETLARPSCSDPADADVVTSDGDDERGRKIEWHDLLRRHHARGGSFGIASRFELTRDPLAAIAGVPCSQNVRPAR
jgi:hypothetical protein